MKFKYAVGEKVFNLKHEETDYIMQKRVEYGRPYYRLRYDPVIRHENALYGMADMKFTAIKEPINPLLKLQHNAR